MKAEKWDNPICPGTSGNPVNAPSLSENRSVCIEDSTWTQIQKKGIDQGEGQYSRVFSVLFAK